MEARTVDAAAFAAFVRENSASLFKTAYLLTGSTEQAEELLQDTLVRLYPNWSRVQAAERPLAYVRRCVGNAFVSSRRRRSAHELALHEVPESADGSSLADGIADRGLLWQLLTGLPERQRAALVLRYFHDLPDAEIADVIGCRVATVRSLISRGIATMRATAASGEQVTDSRRMQP
jgi:RNA polymerase sigma-70 factor (sigma-E family)